MEAKNKEKLHYMGEILDTQLSKSYQPGLNEYDTQKTKTNFWQQSGLKPKNKRFYLCTYFKHVEPAIYLSSAQ